MSGCKVYYKAFQEGGNPKLRCVHSDSKSYEESRGAVLAQLHKDMEVFYKPMLVLMQGGKK